MRKYSWIIVLALALASCKRPVTPNPTPGPGPEPVDTTEVNPLPFDLDGTFITDTAVLARMFKDSFADEGTIAADSIVLAGRFLSDGEYMKTYNNSMRTSSKDLRYEFYTPDFMRFVSESDGYALSIPLELGLEPDFTLAKYAQKFVSDKVRLRVSLEHVTPYPATEHYYGVYTGEWLDRYICQLGYVNQNGLERLALNVVGDETIVEGYSVNIYSINAVGLERPYYKIALVRPVGQWYKFGFLLYKCKDEADVKHFNTILKSFKVINPYGRSKNYLPAQEARPNPKWSEETKAYYNKLLTQETLDFGVFTYSMVHSASSHYTKNTNGLRSEKARLEEAFGHGFEIMPTYTHLAWGTSPNPFPKENVTEFAGGNGFNGKPVLQFTYQYTTNNNNVNSSSTSSKTSPLFDILRGKYDDFLIELARGLKAYGRPVLFRLNNEMNTDWTSYCGMINMCDPEMFIDSWIYLYKLFEREGVDNCIWIWNPVAVSCPQSYWSEDLAYYPGNDYVQILGLTAYESGNSLPLQSFREHYSKLYTKSSAVFGQMPWVISEFGCGAGGAASGEEKRNKVQQANWVTGMFDDFLHRANFPYLKPIKGAVWFSANDYSGSLTSNYYALSSDLTETLQAFHDGFDLMYPNE